MEHNHKGTMEGTLGRATLFGIYEMTATINGAEHNKSGIGNGVRERSGCGSGIRATNRQSGTVGILDVDLRMQCTMRFDQGPPRPPSPLAEIC